MKLDIKSVIVGLIVGLALAVLLNGESTAQTQDNPIHIVDDTYRAPQLPQEITVHAPYGPPPIAPAPPTPPRYTAMSVGPDGAVYVLDGHTAEVGRILPGASPQYETYAQHPSRRR